MLLQLPPILIVMKWEHANASLKGRGSVSIPQPKLFHRYNVDMGGVDKMDQLVAVYRSRIRKKMVVAHICIFA